MLHKFICSFCFLAIIAMQTFAQQTWVPFLQQTKTKPSVNLNVSNNSTVAFTVQINGMETSERIIEGVQYQTLSIPDGETTTTEGYPEVPVITKLIAIPDCDNVTISVSASNELHFSNYYVLPAPEYVKKKLPDGSEELMPVHQKNKSAYSNSSDFPGKFGEILETGYVRGQKVARVAIYPVQFNAAGKSIKAYTDFNISLSFVNPKSEVNKELGIFRNMMHHAAINYEPNGISAETKLVAANGNSKLTKASPSSVSSGSVTRVTNLNLLYDLVNRENAMPVDYLIITHPTLFNSSVLTTLANYRMNHNGYDVAIIQVDNVLYNKYPGQNYQDIRDYIKDVYLHGKANHTGDGHLAYVLFVGDAFFDNTTEMVPAAMPTYYSDFEKGGDYYYACTGGDSDDILDLIYGRLPVGNETELSNNVNKIISYENNSNGSWNNDCTFVAGSYDYFPYADPAIKQLTEIVPPTYIKKYGYTALTTANPTVVTEVALPIKELRYTQAEFDDLNNLCGSRLLNDWLYDDATAGINNRIHTFVFEGHGGWPCLGGGSEGCGRQIFKIEDCLSPYNNTVQNRLNNDLYTFMIFNCCNAGHFDNNTSYPGDCLAEVVENLGNKGSIGVLASTRESAVGAYGEVDGYVLEAQYKSLSHIMGEAVMESKLRLGSGLRRQYNLYGDPAVNLWPTGGYTLPENLTLSGTIDVTSDIIVPVGVTLTIEHGTILRFANGASLIVNGTLNAAGWYSNKITFTKYGSTNWGGIRLNSSSSSHIDYCDIQYAGTGIYLHNSSPQINGTWISNCGTAINCDYYSSPTLYYNQIQSNTTGIWCTGGSSPNLAGSSYSLNVIRNNTNDAVYAIYGSCPTLGTATLGKNSIYSNGTPAVRAIYSSYINAINDWWGMYPPSSSLFYTYYGTITYTPALTSNPNWSVVANNDIPATGTSLSVNASVVEDDLNTALDKQRDKKYDEAIPLFLNVFKNNKDELMKNYALSKIEECFTQAGRKDYLAYSKSEIKPLLKEGTETYVVALELETHQMVNAGSYKDAVNNLLMILKKYNLNSYIEKNTLFNLGAFYNLFLSDTKSSDAYFNELKQKYPDDELVRQIAIIKSFGSATNGSAQGAKLIPGEETVESGTEDNSLAISNYPNPFNPTTTIRYSIPEEGKVQIKIFDVLGREVTTLLDNVISAGKHTVEWNASRSASGIYFYSIEFKGQRLYKKMLMLK